MRGGARHAERPGTGMSRGEGGKLERANFGCAALGGGEGDRITSGEGAPYSVALRGVSYRAGDTALARLRST